MLSNGLSRGDVFADRYRVLRRIGSGGMGSVFEAEHIETERRVAMKVLLPQSLVNDSARERFKQEARVAGRLRHPNIVDVLDAGVDDMTNMPYLVMELLEGEDLASRISRLGPISPEETVALLRPAAAALDCLHERSIVHRDLKPENLFLTWNEDGSRSVKLLDFGVAKVIAEGMTSALTQDAQGTPVYMAPEQFAEQIRISPATDIYALGMLAFTLLTGENYWGTEIARGMNVFMLARVAEAGPKEPASVRAKRAGATLPPAFDEWFSTITAIVPGERYPTASVAIEVLADVLGVPYDQELAPAPRRQPSSPAVGDAPQPATATAAAPPKFSLTNAPPLPPTFALPPGLASPPTFAFPPPPPKLAPAPDVPATMVPPPPKPPTFDEKPRRRAVQVLDLMPVGPPAPGSTPPRPLRQPDPFWKRPTIMSAALVTLAAAVGIAVAVQPSRSLRGAGMPDSADPPAASGAAIDPPGASAPSSSASSSSASAPSTPSPSASAAPSSGASAEPSPSSSASSGATSATASPGWKRPPRWDPKRPRYTRD
jgi:serine/threonine-protein kinase